MSIDPRLQTQTFPYGSSNPQEPGNTVPYPMQSPKPTGYWANSEWQNLQWQVGTEDNVAFQATWSSPTMDMRTDTASAKSARQDQATPMNRQAGAQMFIAIKGLSANHRGMNVYVEHYAHPVYGDSLLQVAPAEDITALVDNGLDSTILTFYPPGGAYYIRFWRCKLVFKFVQSGGSLPSPLPMISVQSAVY